MQKMYWILNKKFIVWIYCLNVLSVFIAWMYCLYLLYECIVWMYCLYILLEYIVWIYCLYFQLSHAHYVDGPVLDSRYLSFVGMHPVPVVYGMTIGEYALMINGEGWLVNNITTDLNSINKYFKSYIISDFMYR